MKRILTILAFMVGIVTMQAQSPDFSAQIAAYNKTCPKTIDEGVTLRDVDINDGAMRFNYVVTDDMFSALEEMKDILRDSFAADLMTSSEPLTKSVVTMCKALKTNIQQRFISQSGKEFTLEITAAELN